MIIPLPSSYRFLLHTIEKEKPAHVTFHALTANHLLKLFLAFCLLLLPWLAETFFLYYVRSQECNAHSFNDFNRR